MNRQEILDEINKTKEHLTNMEKMLEKCEYERWKPEPNEEYYFVSENGKIVQARNCGWEPATNRIDFYNCFKSEKQAEAEAEKILVRRMLEDIARRLNKGKEFDWSDEDQYKWYIIYNTTFGFETYSVSENTDQGVVYCLDKNFLNTAIKEIGEGRLMKYLRGK